MNKVRFFLPFLIFAFIRCSAVDVSQNVEAKSSNQLTKSNTTNSEVDTTEIFKKDSEPTLHIKGISCEANITRDQLRAKKELIFEFASTCDSVRIRVPSGGSVTDSWLYTDSTTQEKIANTSVFTIGETGVLTFSSQLKGRFFITYNSCNWSIEKWITLE